LARSKLYNLTLD